MENSSVATVWKENISVIPGLLEDAVFGNDSLISYNWTTPKLGCSSWKPTNHTIFQIASAALCLGLLSPPIKYGVLFMHSTFALSFLFTSIWAWVVLCAPDYFSWNVAFMVMNMIQTLTILYNIKPIKFDENMERLYQTVFQPMNVSRNLFKKLIDQNYCIVSTLYEGDAYAVQGITKTDRLGLLVAGTMIVYSHQTVLHYIQETEFIDSPEFESSVTGDEKFQVSIYAASTCHYIYWPRQSLEYILLKEQFLATVLNTIMGRDITNKLYALNNRAKDPDYVSPKESEMPLMVDPSGRVGDLRRTLAQLSTLGNAAGRPSGDRGNFNHASLVEEQEESEGPYSAAEEEVELLNLESRVVYDNHLARSTSVQSDNSNEGIQFTVKNQSRIHFQLSKKVT